jgi:hypothetical protein
VTPPRLTRHRGISRGRRAQARGAWLAENATENHTGATVMSATARGAGAMAYVSQVCRQLFQSRHRPLRRYRSIRPLRVSLHPSPRQRRFRPLAKPLPSDLSLQFLRLDAMPSLGSPARRA